MTKQHRSLIFVTFLISCVALALLLVSIGTSSWVLSTPKSTDPQFPNTKVNFGLFTGLYDRPFPVLDKFGLTVVCLYNHNICGLSCKRTADERKQEFELLYNGKQPKFYCDRYTGRSKRSILFENITSLAENNSNDLTFINSGVLLSTIIFLCIAIILSTVSCVITVMNMVTNPIQSILNILGLYIWNSLASLFIFMVILLWGIHFATTITHNIALRDTIVQQWTSDGQSSLGYSYWLLLASMLLHIFNVVILFLREYLISKEAPTIAAPSTEQTDGTIFLY